MLGLIISLAETPLLPMVGRYCFVVADLRTAPEALFSLQVKVAHLPQHRSRLPPEILHLRVTLVFSAFSRAIQQTEDLEMCSLRPDRPSDRMLAL